MIFNIPVSFGVFSMNGNGNRDIFRQRRCKNIRYNLLLLRPGTFVEKSTNRYSFPSAVMMNNDEFIIKSSRNNKVVGFTDD